MSTIRRWSNTTEDSLRSESRLASLFSHRGLIGETREKLLRAILEKFLPRSLTLGQGQILDANGNKSRQIDIVVARGDTIQLPLGNYGNYAFLIESTLGTIEVKSKLEATTLVEAFRVINSICSLGFSVSMPDPRDSEDEVITSEQVKEIENLNLYPSTYIYAFESRIGNKPEAFGNAILTAASKAGIEINRLPDVIGCEGWVAIKNNNTFFPSGLFSQKWIYAYRKEEYPLYWILIHLLHDLIKLGSNEIFSHTMRYQIEAHLEELPEDGWNLILDPSEI